MRLCACTAQKLEAYSGILRRGKRPPIMVDKGTHAQLAGYRGRHVQQATNSS